MGESGYGYWVVLACLVTNLNLTLEVFVAEPLNRNRAGSADVTYYYTAGNETNANADMCCRLLPEWSELLCVAKAMTSTSGRFSEGKAKSPVFSLEENGHLQDRLFNMLPLIGDGVWVPHCLGDHGASSSQDGTVKQPRRHVERMLFGASSVIKEEMALSVVIGYRRNLWNGGALQQI